MLTWPNVTRLGEVEIRADATIPDELTAAENLISFLNVSTDQIISGLTSFGASFDVLGGAVR